MIDPQVAAYYADRDVQARIREYCGADVAGVPDAVYVATIDETAEPFVTWEAPERRPVHDLPAVLESGRDIARSLWDTRHLVLLIDVDHQHLDAPGDPFFHPTDAFVALEPTFRAVHATSARFGLQLGTVMTGRGYHFIGVVRLDDPVVDALAGLAVETPAWWRTHEQRRPAWAAEPLSERQARAHAGLGMLVEYLAHLVHDRAAPASPVPVTLNGTIVGVGVRGRESVSIDFSHFGDPLDIRQFRVCFGAYQWHRCRPDIFGGAASLPALVALPRHGRSLASVLGEGRGLEAGARRARTADAHIPDVSAGVTRLLAEYLDSRLAAFHRRFLHDRGRDLVDLAGAPPCVTLSVGRPNDLLLKPEHLQHLVRWGLSSGARARQIAELVTSRYESEQGWGERWDRLDARTRAEFDVRVFAGLVETGRDRLVDFNCVSAQEKDICPRVGCPHDLRTDRDRLLAREAE